MQEQTHRKKDNNEGEEFDFISNSHAFIESPTNSPQFIPNLVRTAVRNNLPQFHRFS